MSRPHSSKMLIHFAPVMGYQDVVSGRCKVRIEGFKSDMNGHSNVHWSPPSGVIGNKGRKACRDCAGDGVDVVMKGRRLAGTQARGGEEGLENSVLQQPNRYQVRGGGGGGVGMNLQP